MRTSCLGAERNSQPCHRFWRCFANLLFGSRAKHKDCIRFANLLFGSRAKQPAQLKFCEPPVWEQSETRPSSSFANLLFGSRAKLNFEGWSRLFCFANLLFGSRAKQWGQSFTNPLFESRAKHEQYLVFILTNTTSSFSVLVWIRKYPMRMSLILTLHTKN